MEKRSLKDRLDVEAFLDGVSHHNSIFFSPPLSSLLFFPPIKYFSEMKLEL